MPQNREPDRKLYLADVIGVVVRDPTGSSIGTVSDFTMLLGDRFPRLPQIVVTLHDQRRILVRRGQFRENSGNEFHLEQPLDQYPLLEGTLDQVLLKNIWDKQIVDISDARVMRVNDLQIADVKGEFRLFGVDIGTKGLLRRLGWEKPICSLLNRLRLPITEEIIAWDHVDSLPTNFSHLKLNVSSQKLRDLHPADLADILDDLSIQEGLSLIKSLDNETAAETIAEAETETQVQIIEHLSTKRASGILEEMEPDEAVDILQDLDDSRAAEILSHMKPDEASDVRELLKHDEDTAGGLMSTGFVTVFEEFTVQDAFAHLRLVAVDLEIIYYLYVIDKNERLKGVVTLRDLLVTNIDAPIISIMNEKLISVPADTPQEEVANLISKYDLLALPVLDEDGVMLGVVTVDDVIELLMDHMPKVWKRRALSS
jgi:CBS domain-containing protein